MEYPLRGDGLSEEYRYELQRDRHAITSRSNKANAVIKSLWYSKAVSNGANTLVLHVYVRAKL